VAAGRQAIAIVLDTGSVYTIADLRCMRRILGRQHPDPTIIDELDEALNEIIWPTPSMGWRNRGMSSVAYTT
jgi:hypothetical protein